MVNSENLLSRKEDMNSKMLVFPLRSFAQTVFRTQVAVTAGTNFAINATGLRSGSIKWIDVYATVPSVTGAGNNWNFVPLQQLQMLVNGLIYYDSVNSNNQLWNLCDSQVPLQVSTSQYSVTGGGSPTSSSTLNAIIGTMPFYRIQLGQRPQPLAYENEMSLGLNIANSVVNINATCNVSGTLTLNLVYHYASNLIATKGTMEYLFT
jgi:hypothetical protein